MDWAVIKNWIATELCEITTFIDEYRGAHPLTQTNFTPTELQHMFEKKNAFGWASLKKKNSKKVNIVIFLAKTSNLL